MDQSLLALDGIVSAQKPFCAGWAALTIEGEPEIKQHFGDSFELILSTGQHLQINAEDRVFECQVQQGSWAEVEASVPEQLRVTTPGPHTKVRYQRAFLQPGDRVALLGVATDTSFDDQELFREASKKVLSRVQAQRLFTGSDAVQKRENHLAQQKLRAARLAKQERILEILQTAWSFVAERKVKLLLLTTVSLVLFLLAYLLRTPMNPINSRNLLGWIMGLLCLIAILWYQKKPFCAFFDARTNSLLSSRSDSLIGIEKNSLYKILSFISFPVPFSFIALFQEPSRYRPSNDNILFALGVQSGFLSLYLVLLILFLYSRYWRDAEISWLMLKAKRGEPDGQWQGIEGEILSSEENSGALHLKLKTTQGEAVQLMTKDAISCFPIKAEVNTWVFVVGRYKAGSLRSSGPKSLFIFGALRSPRLQLWHHLIRFCVMMSLSVIACCFLFSSLLYALFFGEPS